jgi:hypothetical protein
MHAVLRGAGARLHQADAGTLRFDLDVRAVAAALVEDGLVGFMV